MLNLKDENLYMLPDTNFNDIHLKKWWNKNLITFLNNLYVLNEIELYKLLLLNTKDKKKKKNPHFNNSFLLEEYASVIPIKNILIKIDRNFNLFPQIPVPFPYSHQIPVLRCKVCVQVY